MPSLKPEKVERELYVTTFKGERSPGHGNEIVMMLIVNQDVMNDFDWNGPEEGRRQRFFDFLVERELIPAHRVTHVKADPELAAKLQSWFEQPSLIQL